MPTPAIQTLINDAQQVLNLDSISAVRSVVAVSLANANTGTPLNPNLTTQQLWNEFYQVVTRSKSDIESIIANQLMKFLYSPPAPGGVGADKQVIFNDGGVLAGDADFLWNKTTNLLTVTGSATITGDLTVDTNTFFVDSANNCVGIGTITPTVYANYKTLALVGGSSGGVIDVHATGGGTAGGLQIAATPTGTNFDVFGPNAGTAAPAVIRTGTFGSVSERYRIAGDGVATWSNVGGVAGTAMTLNSTGLGVGVSPSAWNAGYKALELVSNAGAWSATTGISDLSLNAYFNASNQWIYKSTTTATLYRQQLGAHIWYNAPSGTAGNAITFTQAMTLDASGNLLVGITSGSYNRIKKDVTADAGNAIFELVGASDATSSIHYSVSSYNANAANAASKFGRDGVTLRSINAGGTINASGADYAEYMTKASDFVLAKGDVAGIDANGKLTNVFADAVSFVVKSTDPSYVGNDKWGAGLEGDALEAARQLVDRIAFAGQVPVNVTGAKAGDYIVPVVDGIGIKGIAVSNPTFEQYQLAVGKVIAIDADGRARIIVKVA